MTRSVSRQEQMECAQGNKENEQKQGEKDQGWREKKIELILTEAIQTLSLYIDTMALPQGKGTPEFWSCC